MPTKLIIDGNAVYEVDEECMEAQKRKNEIQRRTKRQRTEKEKSQDTGDRRPE